MPYLHWNSLKKKKTPKTIKLLEENPGKNLCDLGFGKDFLGARTKALFMKRNW